MKRIKYICLVVLVIGNFRNTDAGSTITLAETLAIEQLPDKVSAIIEIKEEGNSLTKLLKKVRQRSITLKSILDNVDKKFRFKSELGGTLMSQIGNRHGFNGQNNVENNFSIIRKVKLSVQIPDEKVKDEVIEYITEITDSLLVEGFDLPTQSTAVLLFGFWDQNRVVEEALTKFEKEVIAGRKAQFKNANSVNININGTNGYGYSGVTQTLVTFAPKDNNYNYRGTGFHTQRLASDFNIIAYQPIIASIRYNAVYTFDKIE